VSWSAVIYRPLHGVLERIQREKDEIVAHPYTAEASARLEELDAIEADIWDALQEQTCLSR